MRSIVITLAALLLAHPLLAKDPPKRVWGAGLAKAFRSSDKTKDKKVEPKKAEPEKPLSHKEAAEKQAKAEDTLKAMRAEREARAKKIEERKALQKKLLEDHKKKS